MDVRTRTERRLVRPTLLLLSGERGPPSVAERGQGDMSMGERTPRHTRTKHPAQRGSRIGVCPSTCLMSLSGLQPVQPLAQPLSQRTGADATTGTHVAYDGSSFHQSADLLDPTHHGRSVHFGFLVDSARRRSRRQRVGDQRADTGIPTGRRNRSQTATRTLGARGRQAASLLFVSACRPSSAVVCADSWPLRSVGFEYGPTR